MQASKAAVPSALERGSDRKLHDRTRPCLANNQPHDAAEHDRHRRGSGTRAAETAEPCANGACPAARRATEPPLPGSPNIGDFVGRAHPRANDLHRTFHRDLLANCDCVAPCSWLAGELIEERFTASPSCWPAEPSIPAAWRPTSLHALRARRPA